MKNLKKIGKVVREIFLGGLLFYSSVLGIGLLMQENSLKIKSKSHLEILVNQEKKKLGIENKNIKVSFCDTLLTSQASKTGENSYEIQLSINQMYLGVLKHELYHISDGHVEYKKEFLQLLFLGRTSSGNLWCNRD